MILRYLVDFSIESSSGDSKTKADNRLYDIEVMLQLSKSALLQSYRLQVWVGINYDRPPNVVAVEKPVDLVDL